MLLSYGMDWLNLLLRWLHLVSGIAWIGASFYFIWLDNTIRPPKPGSDLAEKGVAGELWAVHGGGFYHPQKYLVAPKELPETLHWFKWEAYVTWLSGFALLLVVYYFHAPAQTIGIGLGALVAGWVVYDLLCRSPLSQRQGLLGIAIYLLLVVAAFVLSKLLSGRAAYLHAGAMIGTIMAGNVAMVIIPAQRKLVDAMRAGRMPDAAHGQRAKQRSVHNNYFTLPVLFIMISHHYAMTYGHPYNWLVLAAIGAAGVSIRHFFNLRHQGKTVIASIAYPVAGTILLLLVSIAIAPIPLSLPAKTEANFAAVQAIITQRCVSCHTDKPAQAGFASPPAGVMLHTPELVKQHAFKIYQQAVQTKAMPIGNLTHMTDEERALIGMWFQSDPTLQTKP